MIIGFYSPFGGVFRTTTTLLTGLVLAEKYDTPTIVFDFDTENPSLNHYAPDGNTFVEIFLFGKRFTTKPVTHHLSKKLFLVPLGSPRYIEILKERFIPDEDKSNNTMIFKEMTFIREMILDIARNVGAEVVLLDLGKGFNTLGLLALKYIVDGVVIITRTDEPSYVSFKHYMDYLIRGRFLHLTPSDRYPVYRFATILNSRSHEGCRVVVDSVLEERLRNMAREMREELRVPVEKIRAIPVIPELMMTGIDPVETAWINRYKPPYCMLLNSIDELTKSIYIGELIISS